MYKSLNSNVLQMEHFPSRTPRLGLATAVRKNKTHCFIIRVCAEHNASHIHFADVVQRYAAPISNMAAGKAGKAPKGKLAHRFPLG